MWKKALIFSAALLLSAVWLVSDLLLSPLEKPAEVLEIPDFCGRPQAAVERAEWMELVEEYRYDATVPAGTVLSQTPAAGSRRRAVELPIEIRLVISLGEEQIRLPETVGENVRVAAARLRELGCVVEITYETGAEPETEDGLGFYEGTEVYVYQLPYDYEYFTDHPVFTDGDLRLVLGNDYSIERRTRTFTLSKAELTDGTVPAVRYHGDYGFSDQTSFFYRNTTAAFVDDEILYHTYTDMDGRMEFDYSPDGKLMEFRYAERSVGTVSKEDARTASEQFLRAAGIDLTVGYKVYVAEGCYCIYGGEGVSSSQLTRVTWIREIGSTFAEGYTVFCMSTEDGGVAVKLCKSLNLGLCDAYGSITGEQVHHTRARLWEAIGAMRHYEGDAYEPKDSCKWGSLIMGEDGNLYLRIHFQGQSLGHSREGYAYMRVNP